ncbi:hypothetical protein EMIHUDRAFT_454427 [Emiliania huxleyi CCMP1516]|uniref:Uncharacterized protein n=3 Tax=Emiliania huxleyi TaxID=2903 RepID=A0A0D3KUB9_EMIH1|nr:hypothetical protein EMIHUDRAFT_454427 [Emiliania huxleyi CCMP1516]EOD39354.1 hypothetical protein EMIHUDRAFT_454427 [Emiliania huxleyi CCMP1516]|eukprot:XP_005791783.1 hypothetical protein EMIHUDRAFT_454427 [Emiliania huxleyi CCMP1516]
MSDPPRGSHEDACLGALLHREASERELPVSYLALRRWEHNLFWVNWADRTSLVSGNTLWAHYTRSAERADYVSSAFRATAGEARDPFRCGGCGAGWGWSPPHARISCCDKPPPPQRQPPPRRFTDAGPASCGLGGGGAALQLAFWSEYGDVDPRYALRREINAHGGAERRRRAGVEACFVLGMRRRHDPTSPFNVRAWLYFEAGRHGDVDLSPLEAGRGLWPTRGHAAIEWWRRAAEHAAGEQPARFYAFGAVGRLLSLPPPELARLMKPLLEGGDPPPETLQLRQNASSPRHSQGRGLIALPAARIAKSAAAGPAGHAVGRPHHPHHLCCGSSSRLALLLGRMLA